MIGGRAQQTRDRRRVGGHRVGGRYHGGRVRWREGGRRTARPREQEQTGTLGLALPEGVPAPGALEGAQADHLLGARRTPAHAGPFGARLYHALATALDRP